MRLIDADKLKDTILLQDGVNTKTWEQLFKFTIRAIDNAPTVEVDKLILIVAKRHGKREMMLDALRPHGKWIVTQEGRWLYPVCSLCGGKQDVKSNYCPDCGAKMDKKEADNDKNN